MPARLLMIAGRCDCGSHSPTSTERVHIPPAPDPGVWRALTTTDVGSWFWITKRCHSAAHWNSRQTWCYSWSVLGLWRFGAQQTVMTDAEQAQEFQRNWTCAPQGAPHRNSCVLPQPDTSTNTCCIWEMGVAPKGGVHNITSKSSGCNPVAKPRKSARWSLPTHRNLVTGGRETVDAHQYIPMHSTQPGPQATCRTARDRLLAWWMRLRNVP